MDQWNTLWLSTKLAFVYRSKTVGVKNALQWRARKDPLEGKPSFQKVPKQLLGFDWDETAI